MHFDEKHYKLADKINAMQPGDSLKQALMESGYSEQTAAHGWEAVPNRVLKLLAKKGLRLKALGEIDAKTQENLVRGRLTYNVIKGSDKGAMSAKLLGSDRRVNMFTPDNQVGVVVIGAPSTAMEERAKRLLDSANPPAESK